MILHQIWVGSEPPIHLTEMSESWKEMHPHWEYRLWTDSDIEALKLENVKLYRNAHKIVPEDAIGQYKADIARYEILYRFGGVYADMDTTCQKDCDGIFDTDNMVVAWEMQGKWIGNTVVYSPAGGTAVRTIINALPRLSRKGPARPNKLSGPKAISGLLRSRSDVTILDQSTFYPVAWNEPERSTEEHPDAYVVHHWQHQRDLKGMTWDAT